MALRLRILSLLLRLVRGLGVAPPPLASGVTKLTLLLVCADTGDEDVIGVATFATRDFARTPAAVASITSLRTNGDAAPKLSNPGL